MMTMIMVHCIPPSAAPHLLRADGTAHTPDALVSGPSALPLMQVRIGPMADILDLA